MDYITINLNNISINDTELKSILLIQKNYRKYYYRKRIFIVKSKYQNKEWRQNSSWYGNSRIGSCEKYQLDLLHKITKNICVKSGIRINIFNHIMKKLKEPFKHIDGFEWTEDFDGYFEKNNKKYYVNLKFVCSEGGAQNRTLKLVYDFIYHQLNYLILHNHNNNNNEIFLNILDGDCSYSKINHIKNILNKDMFQDVKNNIFIGDMYEFQNWWIKNN
jgi:hypothetical protein